MTGAAAVGFQWENNLTTILAQEPNVLRERLSLRKTVHRLNHLFSLKVKPSPQLLFEFENLRVVTEDEIDEHLFNHQQNRGIRCISAQVSRKLAQLAGLGNLDVEQILKSCRGKFEELHKKLRDQTHFDVEEVAADDDEREENTETREENSESSYYAVEFPAEEKILIKELTTTTTKGDADELRIISIVGMSRVARSTLASRVFYDPFVVGHFDLLARVSMSRLHTRRDCLEALMKSVVEITEDMKEKGDEELCSDLRRYLNSSRYLIVLDGGYISELGKYVFDLLPANMFGSRIILADESAEVTRFRRVNFICSLQPLSTEECRNLLLSKAFGGGECPSELKQISYEIAERCMGQPLATVLISGVLQWRKQLWWWQSVERSLSKISVDDESEVFELIYSHLPHHLKLCLLYSGHFPEECEITARQLITLWIAEGFVVVPENKQQLRLMEELAVEYLEDLISWNLFQPAQRKSDGGVKSLRIHDFLRNLCRSKAQKVKDLEVCVYDESSPQLSRRVSIHSGTLRFLSSNPDAPKLRSLLCFGRAGERVSPKHWKSVHNGYSLLRVLELWGVVVDNIPREIEKLICLRYLRLKSDSAKVLPPSIYNLGNLQTLEVVAPLIERPQVDIWKMRNLRHFYFNGQAVLLDPPKKMDEKEDHISSDLQTLSTISPDSCRTSVLSKVPNVVKLGICGDLEIHKKVAFENLYRLERLRKLKLKRDRRCRKMSRFPDCRKFPPTLLKLTLLQTELSEDPMKQLAQLPNLQVLKLIDGAYGGEVLNCIDCEFLKLKVLKLVNLGMKKWSLSIKSMPSLQNLVIDRCGSLVGLPSDALKNTSTLSELQLRWPNLSVAKYAREIATYKENMKEQLQLTIYHAEDRDDTD